MSHTFTAITVLTILIVMMIFLYVNTISDFLMLELYA